MKEYIDGIHKGALILAEECTDSKTGKLKEEISHTTANFLEELLTDMHADLDKIFSEIYRRERED